MTGGLLTRGWGAFFLYGLFLSIPFLLFVSDWQGVRSEQLHQIRQGVTDQAIDLLEHNRSSCSLDYLLKTAFFGLHGEMQALVASEGVEGLRARFDAEYPSLAGGLPPHSVLVAVAKTPIERTLDFLDRVPEAGRAARRFLSSDLGGVLHHSARILWRSLSVPVGELDIVSASGTFGIASAAALAGFIPILDDQASGPVPLASQSEQLSRQFGFPVDVESFRKLHVSVRSKREGLLVRFSGRETGPRVLFWAYPLVPGRRVLLVSLFDLKKLPSDFAAGVLAARADSAQGIAFISPFGEKNVPPRVSGYFQTQPSLLRALERHRRLPPPARIIDEVEGNVLVVAPTLVGVQSHAAVALPLPESLSITKLEAFLALIVALAYVCGLILIGQRVVLNRGWRLTVGAVTLLSCFSVIFLPNGLGRLILRRILQDQFREAKQKVALGLESYLHQSSDLMTLADSDLVYRMQTAGERFGDKGALLSGKAGMTQELASMAVRFRALFPDPMLRNSLLLVACKGPSAYSCWIPKGGASGLTDLLAYLMEKTLFRLTGGTGPGGEENASEEKLDLAGVRNEFLREFVQSFFLGFLGPDAYYQFLANPLGLIEVVSSLNTTFSISSPVFRGGRMEALVTLISGDCQEENAILEKLVKGDLLPRKDATFLAVRTGETYSGQYESERNPPALWDLINRTRRTSLPISREVAGPEGTLLLQTLPNSMFRVYTLAASTNLDPLFREEKRREFVSSVLMLLAIAFSLALVLALFRHFIGPLRRLQDALSAVIGDDFEVRLPSGSVDEFGNLAVAFNRMTTGLQEGSLLGRYVSSAVMGIIRDKAAFARAQKGEFRPVTVLFSSVRLPSHDEGGEEEVFAVLDAHLRACNETLAKHGGILDKVIAGKILMFFDHTSMGGGRNAVAAALEVVEAVRRRFPGSGSPPYFGLASGPVVAGILGAPQVRLDFTVIGDAVNLSARLNALACKQPGSALVVDQNTRSALPEGIIGVDDLGSISIKGKREPVPTFRVREA